VMDLSALQGMPLEFLDVSGARITDLTPLQGAPLTVLYLARTAIRDLAPLRGMPLKTLRLDGCQKVRDINALGDCAALEQLILAPLARDVAPLRQLSGLKQLAYTMPDNDNWGSVSNAAEFWKAHDQRMRALQKM